MRTRRLLAVLWCPIGAYLLAAGFLWYYLEPRPRLSLRAAEDLVPICFTPDGRWLITQPAPDPFGAAPGVSAGPIRFWDVATGQEHHRILENARDILHIQPSPDARRLAVVRDERLTIVDSLSGETLASHSFAGVSAVFPSATWSPDGELVALVLAIERPGAATTSMIDAATGKELYRLEEFSSTVAFSPDGRFLATGDKWPSNLGDDQPRNEEIRLWDARTGRQVKSFLVSGDWGMSMLEFSTDGSLLMADSSKTVIWEVESGKKLLDLEENAGDFRSPHFLPFANTVAGVDCTFVDNPPRRVHLDLAIKARDPRTREVTLNTDVGSAWSGAELALSPNGRLAGVLYTSYGIPIGLHDALRAMRLGGSWLSGHVRMSCGIFDLESGRELLRVRAGRVVFSPGTLIATSTEFSDFDGIVRIYDVADHKAYGLIFGWALAAPLGIVILQLLIVLLGMARVRLRRRPAGQQSPRAAGPVSP